MMKKPWQDYPQIASSEITPEAVWLDRRNLMKAAAVGAGLAATGETLAQPKQPQALSFSAAVDGTAFKATEDLTPYEAATTLQQLLRVRYQQIQTPQVMQTT